MNKLAEEIGILEEMIENANIENMDMNDCFGGEHIEAIDHILSDYKRVLKINEVLLKENEELKEKIREHTLLISPYYVKENYIPVQKIKDKIEELNRKIDESVDDSKRILQELLESEE